MGPAQSDIPKPIWRKSEGPGLLSSCANFLGIMRSETVLSGLSRNVKKNGVPAIFILFYQKNQAVSGMLKFSPCIPWADLFVFQAEFWRMVGIKVLPPGISEKMDSRWTKKILLLGILMFYFLLRRKYSKCWLLSFRLFMARMRKLRWCLAKIESGQ